MSLLPRLAVFAAAISLLAGCAVTSIDDSAGNASRRVAERRAVTPAWPPAPESAAPQTPAGPLDLPGALAFAFAHNPDIRRQYARLGIAQADLQAAARIANPTLSFAWLDPSNGSRDQTTRGIAVTFSDLLLLPSRKHLSNAKLRRTELMVGASLMTLAKNVETAWYADAGATQAAALSEAAADTARTAFVLAERYFTAGNIPQLQLDEARAQAARSRIAALAARSRAADARAQLANLLGLRSADAWQTTGRLPAPPGEPMPGDGLVALALAQRFDLAAAHEEVAMRDDAEATARRWRLLGPVETGYVREREVDDSKLRGPTLALALPLFDQGQGEIARAGAEVVDARARRDALALAIENEVSAGAVRLELAREIAAEHRDSWLPAAASAVDRRQERVNFMLEGVFTLLSARRELYEAQAAWIGTVGDYWSARAALRAAVGGFLPGDDATPPPAIDVGSIAKPAADVHQHHGAGT